MFRVSTDWNPIQAEFRSSLADANHDAARFGGAIKLCLKLHALLHAGQVSGAPQPTLFDELWDDLSRTAFETMPTAKDETVAWSIWHITRIEDLTANLLIAETKQVLDDAWLARLGVAVRDTGNAMSDDEILDLSRRLDMDALYEYRAAVGIRTREIIRRLEPKDINRKVSRLGIERIRIEGGVTDQKDSNWLLDYWGSKTVAGILLMPVTRHQVGHLNEAVRLKNKIGV